MAPELTLHQLPGEKRAAAVAAVVEELFRGGQRVVVWVADDGRRQILDDYLWTYARLAFVPHAAWSEGMDAADEPVVLLGRAANPNCATVLVVGDEPPPLEWAATFAAVHDFVPPGEPGEARGAYWAPLRGV